MSPLWRRMCISLFGLSFTLWEIAVISVSGVVFGLSEKIEGAWIIGLAVFLLGTLLVVMIHAYIGASLEQMQNIAILRRKLCGDDVRSNNVTLRDLIEGAKSLMDDEDDEDYGDDEDDEEEAEGPSWICPYCKTENEFSVPVCKKCRIKKSESFESRQQESFVPWRCPRCGTQNAGETQFCTKCNYDIDSQ